jgi:hypothetical protein
MLSVPSRSPKRCRHTVWPVEAVAAPGGDIGVTMEDLAMGRPHAADRLMALSEQSRKLAQHERQGVKDHLVARDAARGRRSRPLAATLLSAWPTGFSASEQMGP